MFTRHNEVVTCLRVISTFSTLPPTPSLANQLGKKAVGSSIVPTFALHFAGSRLHRAPH